MQFQFRSALNKPLRWGILLLFLGLLLFTINLFYSPSYAAPTIDINISESPLFSGSQRRTITWDYAYECSEHGFNGALFITKNYGKHNLTPLYDIEKGPSDWLYPTLLRESLSMYKITHDKTYLDYARGAAAGISQQMLNDKNIIRMYSFKNGASDTQPTNLNNYLLTSIAELAIYDPSYRPLAKRVADGIIDFGLSPKNIPYGSIYPNGTAAEITNGLPSNGGNQGSISITIVGLLRTYESTGNMTYLNKSHDILMSIWNHERTRYNLIPRIFNSETFGIVKNDTQLYATGELLRAYIYYYYLTHDKDIKSIINRYSSATYNDYWSKTTYGTGYFVYRVDTETGRHSSLILETNWHKLDISLIYAGEIVGRDYTKRVYQDMRTFWIGDRPGEGLSYKNHLFRHGTNFDGSPAKNRQSLLSSSLGTANYIMIRMLNSRALNLSDRAWTDKVLEHIESTRFYHHQKYGYYGSASVEDLKPVNYSGLVVVPGCGEFASLVTLTFNTTPNVEMVWESFPLGDHTLEPFPTAYSTDDIGFMRGVFMDRSHREIAFRNIISKGDGRIDCAHLIGEIRIDGRIYTNWHDNIINTSPGSHEYIIIFKGGSYIPPTYF